jgi:hypothetical protein
MSTEIEAIPDYQRFYAALKLDEEKKRQSVIKNEAEN